MFRLTVLCLLIVTVVGCGKSSDPIADNAAFKALKSNPYERKAYQTLDQSVAPYGFLDFGVDEKMQSNNGTFVEGTAGELPLRVTPFPGISNYVLTCTNLPPDARLTQSPHDANLWLLDWTPPKGTVLEGDQKIIVLQFTAGPKTTDQRYSNMISQRDITVVVDKVTVRPRVVSISDPSGGKVTEGETVDFSILVSDPSSPNIPPTIGISPFDPENKENIKNFGFIQPNVQKEPTLENGMWRIYYRFSTAGFSFDQSNLVKDYKDGAMSIKDVPNTARICVNFDAIGASKMASLDSIPKCWTVSLQQQSPDFVFLGAPLKETELNVVAGPNMAIEYRAFIPNKRGTAEVQVTTPGFANLPGHPVNTCSNGDGNDATIQVCKITWTDPCKAKGKFDLKVMGTNKGAFVGGQPKNPSNVLRHIVIAPPTEGCSVNTQAAPAVVAPKTTVPAAPATTVATATAPVTTPDAATVKKAERTVVRGSAGALTEYQVQSVPETVTPDSKHAANFRQQKLKPPMRSAQDQRTKKQQEDAKKKG